MGGAATHSPLRPHFNKTSSSHHLHDARVHSHPFQVGASVEVRTHEADFKETYFSATVISLGDVNSGKIQVEYQNLLVPRTKSLLLREYVDISCVRPQPPSEEAVGGFGPGDAVDALYQDGWWIGLVTRVVEEGAESKYIVTFQNPPDELEFGLSELRVHWDWFNESWVRPDRQSIAGLIFNMKKEVEVSFDREDGQDAWYPAIIHEHLDNGMYLVKYYGENEDLKAQTLQIKVDSLHLRPRPPLLKDKNFVLLGKVDAYFNCCWWSGLIRRVLENSNYLVAFKQLNTEKIFHQSDLRPHMEWKDGKWFTSPQDVMILSSEGGMGVHLASENSSASMPKFPVNNFGDKENTIGKKAPTSLTPGIDRVEQLTPDSQKAPAMTPLTRRRRQSSDLRDALSESQKKLKEGPVLVEKQPEKHDRTTEEMLSGSVSPITAKNVETPGKQSDVGDISSYNPSWGKRTRRGQNIAHKINSTLPDIKNSSAQPSQVENMHPGKEPDVVDITAKDVQNEHVVVIGLPCSEMVISGLGKSRGKRNCSANSKETMNNKEKQKIRDSTTQKIEEIKLIELGEFNERRKRGRPRKIPTESVQTPVADDSNTKDDCNIISEVEAIGTDSSEKMTLDGGTSPYCPKGGKGEMMKKTSARKSAKKIVKESMQPKKSVSERGKRRNTISLQVEDSVDASGGKPAEFNSTPEVNTANSEALGIELDDQPLSKWIEGRRIQSPSTVDGSRILVESAVEESIENREKQGDIAAVLKENPQEIQTQISTKHQNLPFAKTNLLWKTIKSLDAFRMLPQNPHFQPLENIKESMREGLAIGHMVNFSSVIETTRTLQFDDPKSTMYDILEMLAELEEHGFDVRAVRARVANLLAFKDKEAGLRARARELNCEISGHQLEKGEMEKEIENLKEQVQKLQEKLSQLESAKERKEDEMASSGTRVRETEQSIENLRLEFNSIAGADVGSFGGVD